MPQKVIKFTGINRKVNEFQSSGACEELINLRPSQYGMEVVKTKKVKFSNIECDVYNHSFADKDLFVGIYCEHDTLDVYLIDNKTQVVNATLIGSHQVNGTDYDVAFVGNQMIISCGYLIVYAYTNGKYERIDAELPNDIEIKYTVNSGYGASTKVSLGSADPKSEIFKSAIIENWSAAKEQNSRKDEIFGPVMVAFNFSMSDGTELWTNKWMYINPFTSLPEGDNGNHMIYYKDGSSQYITFNAFKLKFTVSKSQFSTTGVKNLVKSMNVYASVPIFPYDIDTMKGYSDKVHEWTVYAQTMNMEQSKITNQLLYFQKSIPISEIHNGAVTFTLDFGNSQAGERILNIDNGTTKRAGKMVAYNSRVHFYDSYSTIFPQSVLCYSNVNDAYATREAFVHLECEDRTLVLRTTAKVPVFASNASTKIACCYPDARAKKILIAATYSDGSSGGYCTINLKPSSRYNFAWGETDYISSYDPNDKITTSNVIPESDTISVSKQYNPFAFSVENSYKMGGMVLDIATSYLPISSTQIGQYPLTVFTSAGIYTMEQGSGESLYGNIIPIQPHIIEGKATSTPHGIFFISSNNLYILSGRDAVDVSEALQGGVDYSIKENESYRTLCFDEKGTGVLYNYQYAISADEEPFDAIIKGARLVYDQYKNELFICSDSNDIQYSYVFNLDTKAYHKVTKKYIAHQSNSRYVTEIDGETKNVVDLFEEMTGTRPVLLQSRPFALEELYSHIQRLIMNVDTKLSGNQHLCLSVFASDNLNDWECIISAQKIYAVPEAAPRNNIAQTLNTALRQIRTNRAARSHKDYIILINGVVSTDTNISDIIADYNVVNRRLG